METNQKANITMEEMIADGWIKTEGERPIILFTKPIDNRNPLNNSDEDTTIKLVVHGYLNAWRFAVQFPDGGLLNFVANSMDELRAFEEAIDFYDCPY